MDELHFSDQILMCHTGLPGNPDMFQTKQNREQMKLNLIMFLRLSVLRTTPAQCGAVAANHRASARALLASFLKLFYFLYFQNFCLELAAVGVSGQCEPYPLSLAPLCTLCIELDRYRPGDSGQSRAETEKRGAVTHEVSSLPDFFKCEFSN